MDILRHEDLKELCRKNKASTCGTKEVLFNRAVSKGFLIDPSAPIDAEKDVEQVIDYEKWTVVDLKKKCKSQGAAQGNLIFMVIF